MSSEITLAYYNSYPIHINMMNIFYITCLLFVIYKLCIRIHSLEKSLKDILSKVDIIQLQIHDHNQNDHITREIESLKNRHVELRGI
jgi:hypothetical protein